MCPAMFREMRRKSQLLPQEEALAGLFPDEGRQAESFPVHAQAEAAQQHGGAEQEAEAYRERFHRRSCLRAG